jgi:hypothetical protein
MSSIRRDFDVRSTRRADARGHGAPRVADNLHVRAHRGDIQDGRAHRRN